MKVQGTIRVCTESCKSGGVDFYSAKAMIEFSSPQVDCEFVGFTLEAVNYTGATDLEGETNAATALLSKRYALHPAIREALVRCLALDHTCDEWPGPDAFTTQSFEYVDERNGINCEECEDMVEVSESHEEARFCDPCSKIGAVDASA